MLFAALLAPKGVLSRLLAAGLVAWGQVVLLCEVLSERRQIGPIGFLAGSAVLCVVALSAWSLVGRPSPLPRLPETARSVRRFVVRHPWLGAFAAALALAWAVNAGWACLYEPLDGDANAYHLPRAYYWTTLGTARHFPTSDYRLTQMPPNSSFLAAWVLAGARRFPGLHLFQAVAGLALGGAAAGLARLAGSGRPAALFAGALVLTFPVVVLQMGTPQNDLLVAAAGTAAVYFGARALLDPAEHPWRAAACFGLAGGLAAGTKLTAAFLAPGLALALAAAALARRAPGRIRALLWLGAGAIAGLTLFAAYNAVLNAREFGNPVAAEASFSHFYEDRPAARAGRIAVAARYLRVMPAATPDAGRAAFGPLAFVLGAGAPIVLVGASRAWMRTREATALVRAALVLASAAYAAAFLAAAPPFFPEGARFFVPAAVVLAAAVFPPLFFERGPGRAASATLGVIGLVAAAFLTRSGPDRVRFGAYRDPRFAGAVREPVMASLCRTLPASFPAGARLGIVSEYNDTVFHLFRALPGFDFVPVDEREVPRLVRSGAIAAAIVGEFRGAGGQGVTKPGLAVPRNVIHVPDAGRFFREHPEQFCLTAYPLGTGVSFRMTIDRKGVWSSGSILIRLPAGLARAAGPRALLSLPIGGAVPEDVTASCGEVRLPARAAGHVLLVPIPAACVSDRVFIDLTLARPPGGPPLPVQGEARLDPS